MSLEEEKLDTEDKGDGGQGEKGFIMRARPEMGSR